MTLVLGVDGGGSKVAALAATDDGQIRGAARRLGSADIYGSHGPAAALELIVGTAVEAIAVAGGRIEDIGIGVFSLVGADWPEDFELLRRELRTRLGPRPVVVNDAMGALEGAVPDGPAVVVSLGTGAATGARGPTGRTWHSSFWQTTQGANELAGRAVDAMVDHELGIGPPSEIGRWLQEALDETSSEAVLHRFTGRHEARSHLVPRIIRALRSAAASGDAVAVATLDRYASEIGRIAAAAAVRVGIDAEAYEIAFTGGLADALGDAVRTPALAAVRAAGQRPRPVAARWPAAIGAVILALRELNRELAVASVAERLDTTAPDRPFWHTEHPEPS